MPRFILIDLGENVPNERAEELAQAVAMDLETRRIPPATRLPPRVTSGFSADTEEMLEVIQRVPKRQTTELSVPLVPGAFGCRW